MSTPAATRGHVGRQSAAWLAVAPMLVLLVVIFLWPIALAARQSIHGETGALSLVNYRGLLESSFLLILGRTVVYAALVTIGCVLGGVPIAYALLRARGWVRALLMTSVVLPFFAGSLVRSYAWLAVLGQRGVVNEALLWLGVVRHPLELAYTFPGLIAASIQIEMPIFVLPVYAVMRRFDGKLLTAAHSLGADPITAWFTVFLPSQWHGIATSVGLVFLTSLGFYVTPVLLGPPSAYLLSQELEVRLNTLGDQPGAAARIVVMLAIMAVATVLLLMLRRLLENRAPGAPRLPVGSARFTTRIFGRLASSRWWLVGLPIGLLAALSLLSQLVIVPLAFSSSDYLFFPPPGYSARWVADFIIDPDLGDAFRFSLATTLTSAGLSVLIGGGAALASLRLNARSGGMIVALSAVPLVVPSIVTASGLYLAALHVPDLPPAACFIAIFTAYGVPLCFLVIRAAAAKIDPRLSLAAASLGAAPWTAAWTIGVPLLLPAIATGFLFAFLTGFDDISAGLFFSTSDSRPLAMALWEQLRDSVSPLPAAVALVVAVGAGLTITAAVIVLRIARIALSRRLTSRLYTSPSKEL